MAVRIQVLHPHPAAARGLVEADEIFGSLDLLSEFGPGAGTQSGDDLHLTAETVEHRHALVRKAVEAVLRGVDAVGIPLPHIDPEDHDGPYGHREGEAEKALLGRPSSEPADQVAVAHHHRREEAYPRRARDDAHPEDTRRTGEHDVHSKGAHEQQHPEDHESIGDPEKPATGVGAWLVSAVPPRLGSLARLRTPLRLLCAHLLDVLVLALVRHPRLPPTAALESPDRHEQEHEGA